MSLRDRRIRLLLGLLAAIVVAGVLVAPVVIGSGGGGARCAAELDFRGNTYTARPASGFVQAVAVGVGVVHGCGGAPQNVDVRSLPRVATSRAIAVSGEQSSVYVRRGLCASASASTLIGCLERG